MESLEEEKSPNITLVSAISLPEPGGVSNYVDVISKEPFIKKIFTFNFKTPDKSQKQGKYFYLKKMYFKSTKISFFLRIGIMAYFLRKYATSLLYVTDASISGLAAFLSGKKYIVRWVGDFSYESHYTRKIYAKSLEEFLQEKKDWKRYVQQLVLKKASLIIVPSHYLKKILKKYYEIEEEKIKVIPNFSYFSEKEKIKRNPEALIFVGRMAALKQPQFMLKIYVALNKKYDIYMIGTGPLNETLKKIIKKLKYEKIKIVGYKNKKEMKKYLAKALAVVLPSIYEGQSFTALEMLSLGIPVIIRDLEANKELLTSQYQCFFKNEKECVEIIKLLEKKVIKCRSLKNHNKFSYKNHVIKLNKVFIKFSNL